MVSVARASGRSCHFAAVRASSDAILFPVICPIPVLTPRRSRLHRVLSPTGGLGSRPRRRCPAAEAPPSIRREGSTATTASWPLRRQTPSAIRPAQPARSPVPEYPLGFSRQSGGPAAETGSVHSRGWGICTDTSERCSESPSIHIRMLDRFDGVRPRARGQLLLPGGIDRPGEWCGPAIDGLWPLPWTERPKCSGRPLFLASLDGRWNAFQPSGGWQSAGRCVPVKTDLSRADVPGKQQLCQRRPRQ